MTLQYLEGVFVRRDLFTIHSVKIIKQTEMLTTVWKIFNVYFHAEVQPPGSFYHAHLPVLFHPDAILLPFWNFTHFCTKTYNLSQEASKLLGNDSCNNRSCLFKIRISSFPCSFCYNLAPWSSEGLAFLFKFWPIEELKAFSSPTFVSEACISMEGSN